MWRTGFFLPPPGGSLPPPGESLPLRGRWLAAGETDEGTKPSPGRGWQGEALTGVGRYEPGPGVAPLPALRDVPFIRDFCGRQVFSPHPSGPEALPPSPQGKASSGGGCPGGKPSPYETGVGQNPLLGEGGPAKPGREWGGTGTDLVPPLIRRKRGHLPPGEGRG